MRRTKRGTQSDRRSQNVGLYSKQADNRGATGERLQNEAKACMILLISDLRFRLRFVQTTAATVHQAPQRREERKGRQVKEDEQYVYK